MVPYLWRIEPTAAPRSHVAWWLPETTSLRIEHLNLFLSKAAIDSDKTQESFHYYPPPSQRRVDTVPLKRCLKRNGAPSRQGTPFLAKTVEAALSVVGQRPPKCLYTSLGPSASPPSPNQPDGDEWDRQDASDRQSIEHQPDCGICCQL